MVRTQIQLTELQARSLKERAIREKVSMAELIRRSVDELLTKPTAQDREAIRRRAKAAVGFLGRDVEDLSINHDAYLMEAFMSEPPAK